MVRIGVGIGLGPEWKKKNTRIVVISTIPDGHS